MSDSNTPVPPVTPTPSYTPPVVTVTVTPPAPPVTPTPSAAPATSFLGTVEGDLTAVEKGAVADFDTAETTVEAWPVWKKALLAAAVFVGVVGLGGHFLVHLF
jgi:hypothetical protein